MGIFDSYVEEENYDITLEDYVDLLENSFRNYLDDEEFEPVTEGANMDITNEFISMRKELRAKAKETRKAIKAQDYNEAQKCLDATLKIINDAEKSIRAISAGRIDSVLCGFLGSFLLDSIEATFPLIYFVDAAVHGVENDLRPGADGGLGFISIINFITKKVANKAISSGGLAAVSTVVNIYRSVKTFIKELKNKDNEPGEAWNSYRNRILRFLDEYKKAINNTKKDVTKIKKAKESK
ncbi:MAG: hypothetical protein IKR19_07950 [Acholeplasmatales bacterium]|nr:hypothetical protein [Acholeplasmatales bacterium]